MLVQYCSHSSLWRSLFVYVMCTSWCSNIKAADNFNTNFTCFVYLQSKFYTNIDLHCLSMIHQNEPKQVGVLVFWFEGLTSQYSTTVDILLILTINADKSSIILRVFNLRWTYFTRFLALLMLFIKLQAYLTSWGKFLRQKIFAEKLITINVLRTVPFLASHKVIRIKLMFSMKSVAVNSVEHISFIFLTTAPYTNSIIHNFLDNFLRA